MSPSSIAAESRSLRKIVVRRAKLAVALMCVVAFGLVFPFPFEGRLSGEIFDLAHAPVFCAALLCLIGFCDPPAIGLPNRFATILPMKMGRAVAITIALMIAGIVGEYAQKFAGRNASWGDVLANSAGMLAALAWVVSRRTTGFRRRGLVIAAVGLIAAISLNPVLDVWDSVQQIRSFPMLSSLERPRELGSWARYRAKLERSTEWASEGKYSLKATLPPGKYPGVALVWFERDWREYSQLHLDLMNPNDEPLTVTIKLFDEPHTQTGYQHDDRFTRSVTLQPGVPTPVAIKLADVVAAPRTRKIDLQRMWSIEVFSCDVEQKKFLFVDHLRLTKSFRPEAANASQSTAASVP